MSIINMQRIAVIGLDAQKERLISQLMDFGAVEITDQTEKLDNEIWRAAVVPDESQDKVAELEGKINNAEQALGVIEKYDTGKSPLFKTRRLVKKSRIGEILSDESKAEKEIRTILDLNENLHSLTERTNKLESDRLSLLPWTEYDISLEIQETQTCVIHMGVLPVSTDPTALFQQLEADVGGVYSGKVSSDRDMHYISVIVRKDLEEQALAIMKQNGFAETALKDFKGTVSDNLNRIQEEKETLKKEIEAIEEKIRQNSGSQNTIEEYFDILTIEMDKEKIKTKLLKTKKTFFLEGWIPAGCAEKAREILEQNQCYYAFREPEEGESVPVLLDNGSFFTPFEAITEMYSLPDYRGFDPTRIFALFYAVFFGMMLSDAGYGIVMTIGCFIALKKYPLEGMMYKMIKLFFYCGISTVFWGALFGGWFGDFIQVFTREVLGNEIIVQPLWFNPIEDPMTLLIFSLGLGIVHIFIGMGIKAYMQIRDGHWFDALCDEGFWYLTILGLLGWLGGSSISQGLVTVGMWMTVIGALGLLLTGGRDKKGFGKITGGLGNLYNITSYLSDILSYSRILALGLATGVIAQVVNTFGSMGGGGVKGTIILLVVFVFGHIFNLAINALSAFVHSSRLQYIEFFGKFYEDGGEPFEPFQKNTKYIKIAQDE